MSLSTFHDESNGGRRSLEVTDREVVLVHRSWWHDRETRLPFHGIEAVSFGRGPTRLALYAAATFLALALGTGYLFVALQPLLDAKGGFFMAVLTGLYALAAAVVLWLGRPTCLVLHCVSGARHDALHVNGMGHARVSRAVEAISEALPHSQATATGVADAF